MSALADSAGAAPSADAGPAQDAPATSRLTGPPRTDTARHTTTLPALANSAGAAPPSDADPAQDAQPATSRLAGPSRYDTAAAIAATVPDYQRYDDRRLVRLVSGTRPLDAAVTARDTAPTLFVPPSGPMPATVMSTYRALRPQRIVVVGSTRVISDAQVRRLVGRSGFERLTSDDPTTESIESTIAATPNPGDDGYVFMAGTMIMPTAPLASVAGAAQQQQQPIVVPSRGPIAYRPGNYFPQPIWDRPFPTYGGRAALSDARVRELLTTVAGAPFRGSIPRAGGRDRYETNAVLAQEAFPVNTHVVHLAEGVRGIDAAAGVSLTDGPVLLVPPCGELPASVRDRLNASSISPAASTVAHSTTTAESSATTRTAAAV